MPLGHGSDDGLFVGEIAVDQPHADPGLGADVVHAGLVESALGEANDRGFEDLGAAVKGRF